MFALKVLHWLPKAAFVDILGMRTIYIPSSFLPSQFYRPIGLGLPTRILSHKKDVYRPTNQNLIPQEGCLGITVKAFRVHEPCIQVRYLQVQCLIVTYCTYTLYCTVSLPNCTVTYTLSLPYCNIHCKPA